MKKIANVILSLALLFVVTATPAFAACASTVYYDSVEGNNATGNATKGNPVADYSTAYNIGVSLGAPGTGCIYEITDQGDVYKGAYTVAAPPTGVPLPTPVLYTLLLTLAIGLIVASRWLQRRANQVSGAPVQG